MIQCPYYQSHSTTQLLCRAVDSFHLAHTWKSPKDCELHLSVFCAARYTYCELFSLLNKALAKESACKNDDSGVRKRKGNHATGGL